MSLVALAQQFLESPTGVPLARAALNGDKDELIRLLVAERAQKPALPELTSAAIASRDAILGTVTKTYHELRDAVCAKLGHGPLISDEDLVASLGTQLEKADCLRAAEERVTELASARGAYEIVIRDLKKDYDTVRKEYGTVQKEITSLNAALAAEKRAVRGHAKFRDVVVELAECESLDDQVVLDALKTKMYALYEEKKGAVRSLELMNEDYDATSHGWEELGASLAPLVGLEWNCNNEELLQKVRGLLGDLAESRQRDTWARARLAELEESLTRSVAAEVKATMAESVVRKQLADTKEAAAVKEIMWAAGRNPNLEKMYEEVAALKTIIFAHETREMLLKADLERARRGEATVNDTALASWKRATGM